MPMERSDVAGSTAHARQRVLEDVKQIVADHMNLAPEQIQERSDLEADLGCDSLDIIEITMEIEDHFDVTVPEEVGQEIRTIGQIVDGVLQLLGRPGGEP